MKKKPKQKVSRVVSAAPSFPAPGSNPCPATMMTKMNYVDVKQINVAAPSGQHLYRLCSIFDPDLTGVGHQPIGHDQWATFYGRYRVLGCAYEIKAVSNGDGNAFQFYVGISETSSPGTAITEHPSTQIEVLPRGQQEVKTISGYCDTVKFEGDPGSRFDKDYSAPFGNNPARELFLVIGGNNILAASDVNIQFSIKLTYYVRMYDRIDLSQS